MIYGERETWKLYAYLVQWCYHLLIMFASISYNSDSTMGTRVFCFLSWFIWVFSLFFLVSLARGLFILSKKNNSWFYWLFSMFLFLFYFLSDLHYFPSSDYALSILFLILSGSSLVASLSFPCFWRRPVLLCTSLLGLVLLHPTDFVWLWFHCHLSRGIFKFALWFHRDPLVFK